MVVFDQLDWGCFRPTTTSVSFSQSRLELFLVHLNWIVLGRPQLGLFFVNLDRSIFG